MSYHSWMAYELQQCTHMKPNRYAFLDDNSSWNCVKFGGNFNDTFWIVSDKYLTEEQLSIICGKLGMRPGIDKPEDVRAGKRLGKCVLWFKLEKW